MTKTDTWRRLAVETPEGTTLLFEPSQVFYLETEGHDTLVHAARKKPYRSTRRMADLLTRLPGPPSPHQKPCLRSNRGSHSPLTRS